MLLLAALGALAVSAGAVSTYEELERAVLLPDSAPPPPAAPPAPPGWRKA